MDAVVIFESMYGNTRQVAEAVARGIGTGDVRVLPAHDASAADVLAADLVVIGGPTHVHGMSRPTSRQGAADDAAKHPEHQLEPDALGPGVRELLRSLPERSGAPAAAFDTRMDKPAILTGSAARGIGRRLRRLGFQLVDEPTSFLVAEMDGPLLDGELDRAQRWGASLASRVFGEQVS